MKRRLDDIATANGFWESVSRYTMVVAEEHDYEELINHYADFIARTVVRGGVDVKDIRDEAAAFNDLDAQAVDILGGTDLSELDGADYIEGMSRRIVHHILMNGLGKVKTQNNRIAFRNSRDPFLKEAPMPGMGGLELHDIQALREETEQVELGED